MRDQVNILGVQVDRLSKDEAVAQCQAFIATGSPHLVVTPNAEMVYAAYHDREFLMLLNRADLVVPDGVGVVWAARFVGKPVAEKVAGVELVEALLSAGSYRVFVLGSTPEAAEACAQRLPQLFPGTEVVGFHHGFFTDPAPVVAAVAAAQPQVLLCGLGVPKQEQFLAAHLSALGAPIAVGIGGGIDLWAGLAPRAPLIYRRLGLEWLWRIVKFRRFGRALALPRFVWAVLVHGRRRAR